MSFNTTYEAQQRRVVGSKDFDKDEYVDLQLLVEIPLAANKDFISVTNNG